MRAIQRKLFSRSRPALRAADTAPVPVGPHSHRQLSFSLEGVSSEDDALQSASNSDAVEEEDDPVAAVPRPPFALLSVRWQPPLVVR